MAGTASPNFSADGSAAAELHTVSIELITAPPSPTQTRSDSNIHGTDLVTDGNDEPHLNIPMTSQPNRQLTDRIAAALNPKDLDGRAMLHDAETWDDEHLQRLAAAILPSDLIAIIRKRQA